MAVSPELLRAAGIQPFERVDVYNIDNGERLTTYAIEGEAKEICLNGAAAHKGSVGQRVIIATYTWLLSEDIGEHKPKVVIVGQGNRIERIKD